MLPETWALLRGLKTIDLADNVISGSMPPSWGFLTSVQVINLSSNNLQGNLPGGWTGMEALVSLAATDCQLSGRLGSARLWTALRNLQVLRLGGNSLSGSLPTLWSDFKSLQILDVKVAAPFKAFARGRGDPACPQTPVTRLGFKLCNPYCYASEDPLARGTEPVNCLFASQSNKISGTLPESWAAGALGRILEVLDAGDNKIEGALAAEWGHLDAIEKLRLQQNELKVCGSPITRLLKAPIAGRLENLTVLDDACSVTYHAC